MGWKVVLIDETFLKFDGRGFEGLATLTAQELLGAWPVGKDGKGCLNRRPDSGARFDKHEELGENKHAQAEVAAGRPNTYAKMAKVYFVYLTKKDYVKHWKDRCWVDPYARAFEKRKAEKRRRDEDETASSSSSSASYH
jgi:hypothetical protein